MKLEKKFRFIEKSINKKFESLKKIILYEKINYFKIK